MPVFHIKKDKSCSLQLIIAKRISSSRKFFGKQAIPKNQATVDAISVKSEPVFYSQNSSSSSYRGNSGRGRGYYQGHQKQQADGKPRLNNDNIDPMKKQRRCYHCGSIFHIVRVCPDAKQKNEKVLLSEKQENEEPEKVNYEFFTKKKRFSR